MAPIAGRFTPKKPPAGSDVLADMTRMVGMMASPRPRKKAPLLPPAWSVRLTVGLKSAGVETGAVFPEAVVSAPRHHKEQRGFNLYHALRQRDHMAGLVDGDGIVDCQDDQ